MSPDRLAGLEGTIAEAMAEWQVPGLAITVVLEDEPILMKAYGERDVEAGLPVTLETQFALCSITKSFTAVGLGMLVDDGRLDWKKPVREYIPEFRLHDAVATDRLTVIDLLCHHSGLPRHDWVWMPSDRSRSEMLAALRYLKPSRDIRTKFQYQNAGYLVAGMVVERVTGQSWEDFTSDRVMKPLGMTHFSFRVQDLERAEDAARPYVLSEPEPGKYERRRAQYWPINTTPAGGINISISDIARYARWLLAGGRHDGTQLLSDATLKAIKAPRVYIGPSEFEEFGTSHYGLGLACFGYRGERVVGHSGGWVGWNTDMLLFPDHGLGIVVLTNRSQNSVPLIAATAVADRVLGKEPITWLERLRTRRHQSVAHRAATYAAREAARKPAGGPTRPLAEYAGEYEHPGYGRMTIHLQEGALRWNFRGLFGTLRHRHYDVFEVPEDPTTLAPDMLAITFLYDREGNINRLSAPFEHQVSDIIFMRVVAAFDPSFLDACAGTYQGGPTRHVVTLEASGKLSLSPTGQPTYDLMPYMDRIFSIKGLEGYRVEFQGDESGKIERMVFHQPNGTFVAARTSDG